MFWAYKTIPYNAIRETPYFLAFEAEIIIPVKVGLSSHQTTHFSREQNNDNLITELYLHEERREVANLQVATYKKYSV